MKQVLIVLSVITFSCQNINENTTSETGEYFLDPHPSRKGKSDGQVDGLPHKRGGSTADILIGGFSESGRPNGATASNSPLKLSIENADKTKSRIIETKYGKVQGLSLTVFAKQPSRPEQHDHHDNWQQKGANSDPDASNGFKNKIVEVFLSIPYASPPVKTQRFSPTQTPIPWEGVRQATTPGFVCPQMMPQITNKTEALKEMPLGYYQYLRRVEPYLRNQSEDCLTLSLYVSLGSEPKLRPVVVYIHGGKFSWGSANLSDGTIFAAYADCVFVSVNYRLGVLGFLNLNPTAKPKVANYGLMDQIAALHWIKENIIYFGGDPENITLWGHESGAACIHFLMSSPAVAPGLFHRSILIAGSSYAPWALVSDPRAAAVALAQSLNCSLPGAPTSANLSHSFVSSSNAVDPVLECLKNKPFTAFSTYNAPKFGVDFGPSIDGIVIKPNFRVAPDPQMGKRDISKKYDLMFGLSSFEKLHAFSQEDLESGFEQDRRDAILRTLIRNSYRFHLNEIWATISNEYTDWENSVQHPVTIRNLTVSAVTDCLSLAPVIAAAESSLINRAFFYVFDHSTKFGLYNYQRVGAGAGEELNYMLGYPLLETSNSPAIPFIPTPMPLNYTRAEMALSELMLTYLSNFITSGDPNVPQKSVDVMWPLSKERSRFKSTRWESHDRVHQKALEISSSKVRIRNHYRAHQMAVWLRLVPELQRSGAQFATNMHNRMKGGNDPSLYVGNVRVGHDNEDILVTGTGPSLFGVVGYGDEIIDPGEVFRRANNKTPPSPPTTCPTALSSSSSPAILLTTPKEKTKEKSQFETSFFSPYSTALSVTIAVGCSLLILNVFIFALVYYQRDKRRAELFKNEQGRSSTSSLSSKYNEPPEILKSTSTTATSLNLSSNQAQMQLIQIGQHHPTNFVRYENESQQQQQQQYFSPVLPDQLHNNPLTLCGFGKNLPLNQKGVLLNPTQREVHMQPGERQLRSLAMFATLPRFSDDGMNCFSTSSTGLPKPPPPPRSLNNFATLTYGANNKNKQNVVGNLDELKV